MPDPQDENENGKQITGYCEPWSLRAGEQISLYASSHSPGIADLSLVRLHCGDPTSAGPGFNEAVVDGAVAERLFESQQVELVDQPLQPGSSAIVDLAGLTASTTVRLSFGFLLTRIQEPQTLAWLQTSGGHLALIVNDGVVQAELLDRRTPLRSARLSAQRWYQLTFTVDLVAGQIEAEVTTEPTASPGRDLTETGSETTHLPVPGGDRSFELLVLGGTPEGGDFDGRISDPQLSAEGWHLHWDLAAGMDGAAMVEQGELGRHGRYRQLPTRAVTGPTWDGTEQRWTDDPSQWNAVHFHKDDLYDAQWEPTVEISLPEDLPSGIYAFRLQSKTSDEVDRIPFFVRPAAKAATSEVALLMSTATYLAYANHRMLFEGADFIATRQRLRPEHEYVRTHPELGRSMYEKHPDHSGVMFSSRRRPVLNLRPGADGWNFTPDTDINAFLEHLAEREAIDGHDVISDEDVHHEGFAALEPYRVIVTCSHPEYWSTAMLDALEAWQRNGGRLVYLGGNGFYWRVAFSDSWPGAMELRRAEDGVRNWQTGNGESYHAFTGEYGGMWRRLGRAPNELVGVGFAAQGFAKASHYDVNEASRTSRADWIWDGVETADEKIGTSGLGGGAAGQELDRYDTRLGSPAHAVVLASATEFGPDMVRTKEEFEGSVIYSTPDPYVRSDIVFYETPNGGAVFSVGSISWFGALARNAFDNDIAQMTANVITRFADPEPFALPGAAQP